MVDTSSSSSSLYVYGGSRGLIRPRRSSSFLLLSLLALFAVCASVCCAGLLAWRVDATGTRRKYAAARRLLEQDEEVHAVVADVLTRSAAAKNKQRKEKDDHLSRSREGNEGVVVQGDHDDTCDDDGDDVDARRRVALEDLHEHERQALLALSRAGHVRSNRVSLDELDAKTKSQSNLTPAQAADAYTRLHRKLLLGYDMKATPGQPMNVSVGLTVERLGSLTPSLSRFDFEAQVTLAWYDPRFAWDPKEYGNIKETALSVVHATYNDGDIWFPDFELKDGDTIANTMATQAASIFYDGTVILARSGVMNIGCEIIGLYNFPFDNVGCSFKMGGWTRSGQLLRYRQLELNGRPLGLMLKNSTLDKRTYQEYWIHAHRIVERAYEEPVTGQMFVDFEVTLELGRGLVGYITNKFFPDIFMGFLSTVVYTVDIQEGERISVCITLLLAEVASLLFLSDKIIFSGRVTIMDIFQQIVVGFAVVALFETFVSVTLYYANFNHMPKYIKNSIEKLALRANEKKDDPSTWIGAYNVKLIRRRLEDLNKRNTIVQVIKKIRMAVGISRKKRIAEDPTTKTTLKKLGNRVMLQRQVSKRSVTGKGAGFGGGDSSLQPMFEGQETELLNTVDEEKHTGEVVTIQRRWRGSVVRHKLKDFIADLKEKEANRKLHIESRNISEIGIELSKNLDMFFLNTMPWIYVMTMAILFISIDY